MDGHGATVRRVWVHLPSNRDRYDSVSSHTPGDRDTISDIPGDGSWGDAIAGDRDTVVEDFDGAKRHSGVECRLKCLGADCPCSRGQASRCRGDGASSCGRLGAGLDVRQQRAAARARRGQRRCDEGACWIRKVVGSQGGDHPAVRLSHDSSVSLRRDYDVPTERGDAGGCRRGRKRDVDLDPVPGWASSNCRERQPAVIDRSTRLRQVVAVRDERGAAADRPQTRLPNLHPAAGDVAAVHSRRLRRDVVVRLPERNAVVGREETARQVERVAERFRERLDLVGEHGPRGRTDGLPDAVEAGRLLGAKPDAPHDVAGQVHRDLRTARSQRRTSGVRLREPGNRRGSVLE